MDSVLAFKRNIQVFSSARFQPPLFKLYDTSLKIRLFRKEWSESEAYLETYQTSMLETFFGRRAPS